MSEKELNEIAKQLKIMNKKLDILFDKLTETKNNISKQDLSFKIGSSGDFNSTEQSEK